MKQDSFPPCLSEREKEIVKLKNKGNTFAKIERALRLRKGSVGGHYRSAMRKIDEHSMGKHHDFCTLSMRTCNALIYAGINTDEEAKMAIESGSLVLNRLRHCGPSTIREIHKYLKLPLKEPKKRIRQCPKCGHVY